MIRNKASFFASLTVLLSSVAVVLLFTADATTASASILRAHVTVAAQSSTAPASQATSKPNLAGQWKLNKDQSDDPRAKMQEAGGGEGGSGGGGGGHRGGGMRGGGGAGMMNEFSQLTIEQTDTSVKITGASGHVLAAYPAQQSSKAPANGEGERHEFTPPVAKWQGAQLVATSEGRGGGSTTRTYELSSDGKQLIVTAKIQNPRLNQPVTIRFVYDQVKGSSGSSD
jgi:hypothetical protein